MHAHTRGWFRCVFAVALIGSSTFCGDDDGPDAASGGTGGHAGNAGVSAGQASGGAGAAAGHAGAGAGAAAGSGGSAGTVGAAGAAGSKPAGAVCDPACASGEHCELVQVTCIRAPCPPQAMCMPDSSLPAGGASGAGCGSRGQATCPSNQYCQYPTGGDCGAADGGGQCQAKPQVCTQIYQPVCGCDGQTYASSCTAASAGVSVQKTGECAHAAASDSDCDPRKVTCGQGTPKCSGGQMPSVLNGCYADCVDIETCTCDSPDACPLSDEYTCHKSAAHCGPYV